MKNVEVLVRCWRNFSESRNFSRDVTNEMGSNEGNIMNLKQNMTVGALHGCWVRFLYIYLFSIPT